MIAPPQVQQIHDIYPSSKVSPNEIAEYGWQHVEDIPTITNDHGRLAPTAERSQLHTKLRGAVNENGSLTYETVTGEHVEARDFAVAHSPSDPKTLGFFALK